MLSQQADTPVGHVLAVEVVYANTGQSVDLKVPAAEHCRELLKTAYRELHKDPQPGDAFEIKDEPVDLEKTVGYYAEKFPGKTLVFEITHPTGGAGRS